jgi:isopentenyl diphosphate isomerase/L-lactate dehydrogenase-like FMN-dependent dehydrogenase
VEYVLRCLLADIDLTLALSGCRSLAELGLQTVNVLPS